MAGILVLAWALDLLVEVVAGLHVLKWTLDLMLEVMTGIQVVAGLAMVAQELELTPSLQIDPSLFHLG